MTIDYLFITFFIDYIRWIDVCPTDANLLATGGDNNVIWIFDRRQSKFVKALDGIHKGKICFSNSKVNRRLTYLYY